ncbi:chitin synthase III catalytic subunit [Pisolithus croceorrhizus]|nr:chitin synthase III catalytic subunit [Pisolithus croceorrhizus]KAI6131400.1 chitin synthase III catalytic subunit [Pisolithus croceorrhizus]
MSQFGDFEAVCALVPSYTWCNLFYRQLLDQNPKYLVGPSATAASAPVGVNVECGIPRVDTDGSLGNIADVIACGVSIFIVSAIIVHAGRRKAAVGRSEIRILFFIYLATLLLQLLTTGSLLEQGSTALVALTAIHAGLVATLFWWLLGNAIVATQVVEDGTLSSIIPLSIIGIFFFIATTYISLDVALTLTHTFGPSNPPEALASIPLFVLTSIWPGVAALIYLGLMLYIVIGVLNEIRPIWYYVISAVLFILSQLAYFLLSKVICQGSSAKVDGSFIATLLETTTVVVLYVAWRSITEEDWDNNDGFYP